MNVIMFCGNSMIGVCLMSIMAGFILNWTGARGLWQVGVTMLVGVIAMFAGMVIALVKERNDRKGVVGPEHISEALEKKIKTDMRNMALSISKAVAERVSDRLVAKLSGLHNKEQREAIFGDVDEILKQEMDAVKQAIDSESGLLKKS